MVDGGKDLWTKYIRDNNLKDWIHVYQLPAQQEAEQKAGQPSYRQLYDVFQTPILLPAGQRQADSGQKTGLPPAE